MNRAERRRMKNKKPEPVINVKVSDIENIKKQATNDAASIGFSLMLGIPVLILKDKWGFGKVRLERFIDQVLETYDAFDKDYVSLDDVHDVLWEEVGIKIKR